MPIESNQETFKIVISFTSNKSESQIIDYLNNTVWSNLETRINNVMASNFDNGWNIQKKLKVNSIGNDRWEVYPKFGISGTTQRNEGQLRGVFSSLLAQLKTTLKTDFESDGATDVTFHIHYPDQRQNASDEH